MSALSYIERPKYSRIKRLSTQPDSRSVSRYSAIDDFTGIKNTKEMLDFYSGFVRERLRPDEARVGKVILHVKQNWSKTAHSTSQNVFISLANHITGAPDYKRVGLCDHFLCFGFVYAR